MKKVMSRMYGGQLKRAMVEYGKKKEMFSSLREEGKNLKKVWHGK